MCLISTTKPSPISYLLRDIYQAISGVLYPRLFTSMESLSSVMSICKFEGNILPELSIYPLKNICFLQKKSKASIKKFNGNNYLIRICQLSVEGSMLKEITFFWQSFQCIAVGQGIFVSTFKTSLTGYLTTHHCRIENLSSDFGNQCRYHCFSPPSTVRHGVPALCILHQMWV